MDVDFLKEVYLSPKDQSNEMTTVVDLLVTNFPIFVPSRPIHHLQSSQCRMLIFQFNLVSTYRVNNFAVSCFALFCHLLCSFLLIASVSKC